MNQTEPTYPDVEVQLSGQDGNAFAIMGAITTALRRQVSPEAASEYQAKAMASGSYDELLQHAMATVTVL